MRPWYHATPVPARATPATAAVRGPGRGKARLPAAIPRRSLPPQAASQAPLVAAAAIFAEAHHHRLRRHGLFAGLENSRAAADIARSGRSPPGPSSSRSVGGCTGEARSLGRRSSAGRPTDWEAVGTEPKVASPVEDEIVPILCRKVLPFL